MAKAPWQHWVQPGWQTRWAAAALGGVGEGLVHDLKELLVGLVEIGHGHGFRHRFGSGSLLGE